MTENLESVEEGMRLHKDNLRLIRECRDILEELKQDTPSGEANRVEALFL